MVTHVYGLKWFALLSFSIRWIPSIVHAESKSFSDRRSNLGLRGRSPSLCPLRYWGEVFARMILLFVVRLLCVSSRADGNAVLRELGEKQYRMMESKSSLPQHGTCWRNALKQITDSCDNLNDDEHSALALKLANCFLEDSGHATYNCHEKTFGNERRDCINEMSDRAFSVYNEFYTHSVHMCFFLNYEAWQAETDSTIKRLYEVSSLMKEQLLEASEMQGVMLESQREGLDIQNKVLDQGKELGTILKTSSETVNDMVQDFKESAKDQKQLLYEIFSYLRTFQDWVIGEVSWLQSIVYYTVSCILCALFSSSKRTMDARVTLFVILSMNVVVERMIVQYYNNTMSQATENKRDLVYTTWLYRKVAISLCAATLFCTYYYYKDEQVENHKILKRIEDQLTTMQTVVPVSRSEPMIRYNTRAALKALQSNSNKLSKTKVA